MTQRAQLTVLYCGANPIDRGRNHIELERELRAIERAIAGSRLRLEQRLATRPSDLPGLLSAVKPDVLHFGLHGVGNTTAEVARPGTRDFDGLESSPAGLVLIDAEGRPALLDAASLRAILDACGCKPRCIVLNACHSLDVASELTTRARHVVGMKAAISNDAAIAFSEKFYSCLAHNSTYQGAYDAARRELAGLATSEVSVPVIKHGDGWENERPWAVRRRLSVGWMGTALVALILAFLTVTALACGKGPFVSDVRLALMLLRERFQPLTESQNLRIALIDEQSQSALQGTRVKNTVVQPFAVGAMSWRGLFAQAIDRLAHEQAKVIVFDIVFETEPTVESESATQALATSIAQAIKGGTMVVLPAIKHIKGQPVLARSVLAALGAKATAAHPCIAEPADGPAVPMLPLMLLDENGDGLPPSFALSLSAVAMLDDTTPSWSSEAQQLFLTKPLAQSVAFSGLEYDANINECDMGQDRLLSVQRVLAPFAKDLSRGSARVLPFERLAGANSQLPARWDVKGKIVLIGQRDLSKDIALNAAAPGGKLLWGVSAQAAAIDALLQTDGLMTFIQPGWQMLWIAVLCLIALMVRLRIPKQHVRLHVGSLVLLGVIELAVAAVAAARLGFVIDVGNHLIALLLAYIAADRLRPKFQSMPE